MFDHEGSRAEFLKLLAQFGEEPAFIARGLEPQVALSEFIRSCSAQRDDMLASTKRLYSELHSRIAGDWVTLRRYLASNVDIDKLRNLRKELSCDQPARSSLFQTNCNVLRRFIRSAQKFNQNWTAFLDNVSLEPVNKPRRDFNSYYLVEKGCALDTVLSESDFEPLEMIKREFLCQNFPLLDLPVLA